MTTLYESWSANRYVQIGLRGALAVAVGVMVATGWTLVRPSVREAPVMRVVLFAGGALVLGLETMSPIQVLSLAAIVGLLWPQREAA